MADVQEPETKNHRSAQSERNKQQTGNRTEQLLAAAVAGLGGSTRTNQVEMANAVMAAFNNGTHLAVQAGTGTGKSLAYLVPAIIHAMETDETVVVSTATIALQRQLVERDLPLLVKSLRKHLDRSPSFAILKGRSNYVCKHKVADTVEDPQDAADGSNALIDERELSRTAAQVLRLREWAEESDSGDRDSLTPGVSNDAWKQVSVTARECVGAAKCPVGEECFAEIARRKAADVDIVVTNHAMLAIDTLSDANVLPEHSCVVVDEAHELEGRITSVATDELAAVGLTLMARRAKKMGANDEVERLNEAIEVFSDALSLLADDYRGQLTSIPPELETTLIPLRDALWQVQTALGTASSDEDKAEHHIVRAAMENFHDIVVRILAMSDDDVVWISKGIGKSPTAINVAPLSVATLLRERLFGESTVVLTSATLALGGNFNAMAASWGLPQQSWRGLDVGSPFDPAKKGILYVAADLPRPGRDGSSPEMLNRMEKLIMAAGGRTLGLFSSRRAAEAATEEMRKRLPFDIYCQGEDSIGELVEKFARNQNACLFGTLTLWQGVDVPGPSCSLVIIDRIPFPRPDDPLASARTSAAEAAGRNGFMEVSATHAALLMAQGSGRLLRSIDDRGMVAVLDPRLATARYGSWIRRSMPAFWETQRLDQAEASLKNLVRKINGT